MIVLVCGGMEYRTVPCNTDSKVQHSTIQHCSTHTATALTIKRSAVKGSVKHCHSCSHVELYSYLGTTSTLSIDRHALRHLCVASMDRPSFYAFRTQWFDFFGWLRQRVSRQTYVPQSIECSVSCQPCYVGCMHCCLSPFILLHDNSIVYHIWSVITCWA